MVDWVTSYSSVRQLGGDQPCTRNGAAEGNTEAVLSDDKQRGRKSPMFGADMSYLSSIYLNFTNVLWNKGLCQMLNMLCCYFMLW